MDIQMILSALPGKPMGKADPGTNLSDGHFALALASAGRPLADAPIELPVQLPAPLTAGLKPDLPPTMAAQQAMLQALSAHDPDLAADLEATPLPDSLSLDEIMERLALIEGPAQAEARPLADLSAPQATVAEQASKPTARAETALAAADVLRQAASETMRALETRPASSSEAALNAPLAQQPQQAAGRDALESTPRAALLAQLETNTAERPPRAAEFVRSTEMAPQPNAGELRGMASETHRPVAIEPTTPSLQATTQPAGAAPQPMAAQASLPAPVQSQAWPGQLGQQLVQFARHGGEQQIEMKLNPAELGPLSVTLKMTEQGAQAQFLSAHAQVRQVLEQAIPQLREALAEQGISLGDTSVGEQRQQEGQAFANQDGQRGNGANEGEGKLPSAAEIGMAENTTGVSLDGRVNLYA